jgi:hypothetical protein
VLHLATSTEGAHYGKNSVQRSHWKLQLSLA